MARNWLHIATVLMGVALAATALDARERKLASDGGPQWPNVAGVGGPDADDGPQWPNLTPVGKDEPRYPTMPAISTQLGLDRDVAKLTGRPAGTDADITSGGGAARGARPSLMDEPELAASDARFPTLPPVSSQLGLDRDIAKLTGRPVKTDPDITSSTGTARSARPSLMNEPELAAGDARFPTLPPLSKQLGLDRDITKLKGAPAKTDPDVTNSIHASNTDTTGSTKPSVMHEPDLMASAARWPALAEPKQESPFKFETGLRYWYSGGDMRFAFTNGNPGYGSPTSTLEWRGMEAHSGEVFARLDHKPSGFFIKGVAGLGYVTRGRIDDRDYFNGQLLFSDTTSDVKGSPMKFATVDVGWGYSPTPGMWLGAFIGYHYWNEKVTAYGVICNPPDPQIIGGCAPGLAIGFDTAVLVYEPTWHALRLGFESKVAIDDRWTVNGEIVGVPYATLQNRDSHLLRQGMNDLGPAPNVITDSSAGFGVQTEVFVNYKLTPNIEVGGGVRYWQLVTQHGRVAAGPNFEHYPLDHFDQRRFGVLLHVKGKF